MKKFAFVILHYNSMEDTIICVNSIREKCHYDDYCIYIVDNASPNGSGILVQEKYRDYKDVVVVLNNENLGFARGNNLGIAAAMTDGFSDFIVVLNNDTKIIQNDFCQRICQEFEKSRFAVLGPTIFTPSGKTSINPGRKVPFTGKRLRKEEKMYRRRLLLWKFHMQIFIRLRNRLVRLIKKSSLSESSLVYTENCLLHGCCLIFSKLYLDQMPGFDPRTFLYFEEDILFAHCLNRDLKTVYSPNVEIFHKEDGATDSVLPQKRNKEIFVISNILKSINVYKTVLSEYGKK